MIKYIYSLIALCGINTNAFSQDVITPSLGNDIQAQIIDVTETDIVYKNWNSPDGPTLTMLKSDVLIISYADGKKEVLFKQIEKNKTPKSEESVNTDTKIAIINLAPDQITLKSGVDIQANVIAVNDTAIVYTLFNSVDESTVSISTDRVLLIRYADGTKELIYKQSKRNSVVIEQPVKNIVKTEAVKLSRSELKMKGMEDARINYIGRGSGAGFTAVTSLVLSPVIGLIPAVACASSTPRERNLNIENRELKNDPDYRTGYVKQARKTKATNVLIGYAVGSAAWFILIFNFL